MRPIALGLSLLACRAAPAEATDPLDDEIAELRPAMKEDRVAVVRRALPVTVEEPAAFWPLYLDHQAALDEVRDARLHRVLDFVEQAPTIPAP
jgi:hypothetical protein